MTKLDTILQASDHICFSERIIFRSIYLCFETLKHPTVYGFRVISKGITGELETQIDDA